MPKLTQILAYEKTTKERANRMGGDALKALQKPKLVSGMDRKFRPKEEGTEEFPPEKEIVQFRADEILLGVSRLLEDLYDTVATKERGNTIAKADVVVDGDVVVHNAPATLLLFLERQLSELRAHVEKIVELDPSEEWTYDADAELYKTGITSTHKTAKRAKPIVLYPATEEHPAQTQLINEDILIGWWDTVKMSGALPRKRKVAIIDKIDALSKAVKGAREEANATDVENEMIGGKIFDFVLRS